ncbi:hypothetical protein GJV85_08405 [Sulfurimonas aquatica]|uniref:Uncharacterized protein n=1 Tax=Sulfurimonas aquatica TaxID=2672570 RepID=A0A975B0S5_9BACT|nr:hypothetical protein [Sulfurimonas aquatica]QSZ42131.1 hypothetical protein GJV85_08405 [Sulfurimonas aquatica]
MPLSKEEKNKEEINKFLKHNDIDPTDPMSYKNLYGTAYYVGESRKFAEPTRINFNILSSSDINVSLYEINDIEFVNAFKSKEQTFIFDEEHETLTITGNDTQKHNEDYKVVINSLFPDL